MITREKIAKFNDRFRDAQGNDELIDTPIKIYLHLLVMGMLEIMSHLVEFENKEDITSVKRMKILNAIIKNWK